MTLRRYVWFTAIVLLVVLTISACGKKVVPPPPPPPPAPAPPRAPTEDEIFAKKTLEQLNAEMPLADVFFDFDMANIKDDQRAVLQKNSEWMRRWMSTKVTVEGHADARGTNEYNLALGEKRGSAVKSYLVGLGIAADRINVISKGEEAQVCTEMNEECWAKNRRGHFIIVAK